MLTLCGGGWQAELLPEAGGLIASLTHHGVQVLRTLPAGSRDPLEAACFPLVPYANRVADGRFAWAGREVRLPPNFPPETSSIHGHAWQAEWRVTAQSPFKCAMQHEHGGQTGWPWPYRAEQRVMLGAGGCAISLVVTNLADEPAPMGLGLHPYFRRRPETRLTTCTAGTMLTDARSLPTGEVAEADLFGSWSAGAQLPPQTVDHCLVGWNGTATLQDDLGRIAITATGARHLHVYAPAGDSAAQATLCLEPVSHAPDALNRNPAGMTLLPPRCSASLRMTIAVE